MDAAKGWNAYPGLAAAKQAKHVYGPQQTIYAMIMMTTILDTSFSAFCVDSESFCCAATCGQSKKIYIMFYQSKLFVKMVVQGYCITYSANGHPDSNVAEDDD